LEYKFIKLIIYYMLIVGSTTYNEASRNPFTTLEI
jgi:hypothetical protein